MRCCWISAREISLERISPFTTLMVCLFRRPCPLWKYSLTIYQMVVPALAYFFRVLEEEDLEWNSALEKTGIFLSRMAESSFNANNGTGSVSCRSAVKYLGKSC